MTSSALVTSSHPPIRPTALPKSAATPPKPASPCASTSTAPARPSCHRHRFFRPHARPDRPPRPDRPGHRLRWRPAHRRPPHGGRRGHHPGPGGGARGGRQEGHPPLRPRLRAAGRSAVARGGRLFGPPGAAHARAVHGAACIGGFRHASWCTSSSRALSTTRASRCTSTTCKGDNAHHQCETVFKAFARALRAWRWSAIRARRAPSPPPRVRCDFLGQKGL
jgi:hypothetical protein